LTLRSLRERVCERVSLRIDLQEYTRTFIPTQRKRNDTREYRNNRENQQNHPITQNYVHI